MNNAQIIMAIATSLYGEKCVTGLVSNGVEIPLHTAKGWADRGYRIKKGEHGIETRLWKKKRGIEGDDIQNPYYKAKAFLFTADQVVKEEF